MASIASDTLSLIVISLLSTSAFTNFETAFFPSGPNFPRANAALDLTLSLYWIGLGGYRYNFAADDSLAVDVRETAVTFKTGLTYTF